MLCVLTQPLYFIRFFIEIDPMDKIPQQKKKFLKKLLKRFSGQKIVIIKRFSG